MNAELRSRTKMDTLTAIELIEDQDGTVDWGLVVEAWQHLIDSGMAWQLQGSYGRNATRLIANGICTAPTQH